MTEEQGTARERLESAATRFWGYKGQGIAEWVLDNLPLVLEAAREAGKAESAEGEETYDGEKWWRLLSDPEEQT